MTQSFVRVAILHEGERCADGCPYGDGPECTLAGGDTTSRRRWLTGLTGSVADGFRRTDLCIQGTTQQALDDAVLEAADAWIDGRLDDRETDVKLLESVRARRSATREGGT